MRTSERPCSQGRRRIRRGGALMGDLMQRVWDRALEQRIPLSVQFDLTYRCNERCVHCYLDHDDHGELTTAEVKDVLDQLAAAGTLFLIFSGGELLLRKDLFELLALRARRGSSTSSSRPTPFFWASARPTRIRDLGVRQVQISIYSHRAEVHDAHHQGARVARRDRSRRSGF